MVVLLTSSRGVLASHQRERLTGFADCGGGGLAACSARGSAVVARADVVPVATASVSCRAREPSRLQAWFPWPPRSETRIPRRPRWFRLIEPTGSCFAGRVEHLG